MALQPTRDGKSVFVAGISGNVRNISAELRLDGANGFHKYLYINKGSGTCMIDGLTQGFGTNTLIYIPDSCPHHIDLGVNTHAYAIAIPSEMDFAFPKEAAVLAITTANDTTNLIQLFDAALQEFHSGNTGARMAISSYTGLITVFVNRLAAQEEDCEIHTAAEKLMRRFAYLVEDQFFTGQGLDVYARTLGVTSTHLTRVCQKLNGQSASHFLQDRIISEARRLLLVSDGKIQDISQQLGFTSAAYFSRFFATRLGMSPKEFRQSRDQFRSSQNNDVDETDYDVAM